MTMIDLDTSPLQAAREWRGIGLVAAAMTAGIPMRQAEALEEGDPSEFGSIDEMIAAAIVYGATIGIGRDEAVALLDRTVCGTGAQVVLPDPEPVRGFSGAVQERSARMVGREEQLVEVGPEPELDAVLVPTPGAQAVAEAAVAGVVEPDVELPEVPVGPSVAQAIEASGEIHLDSSFGPGAPWERDALPGELEAWADDFREDDADLTEAVLPAPGVGSSVIDRVHAGAERVLGADRADSLVRWMSETSDRAHDLARDGRERLRRSEHATLFVAIGGGAVLIALLVAIGGVLGGNDEPAGPGPADRAPAKESSPLDAGVGEPAGEATAGTQAATKAKPAAVRTPAQLTLDVFNAGSESGKAKEVAARLKSLGYRIGEVGNAKGDYSGASIIHPGDMAREARVLAGRTGITTMQVAPGSTRRITIVVA